MYYFQEEKRLNKISVESRVRKDRESPANVHQDNQNTVRCFWWQTSHQLQHHHYNLTLWFFLSDPLSLHWPEERLPICVQPGAVPWIFLDFCQHDCSTFHPRSRFVLKKYKSKTNICVTLSHWFSLYSRIRTTDEFVASVRTHFKLVIMYSNPGYLRTIKL